jgi:translocation protein SEC63
MKESMTLKKLFDLLISSLEFKEEFVMRASDEAAIEKLIEEINAQDGGEKYEKTKSLTEPWMIKAHVLLFAYFNRFPISNVSLKEDQEKMVTKACHLSLGMLQIALARQWLQTASQCITLVQCLVQAVWEGHSSLLQLPYIDSAIVKHARGRKTPIRTVRQLVEMPEEDRRSLLRTLSDEQYGVLVKLAKTFPEVVLDSAKFVTLGQPHVIPGGLITVKLKIRLVRASEDTKPTNEDETDDVDVENFEFDEDGNLMDSAPLKSIGKDSADFLNQPIFCPRFPNVSCMHYCRNSLNIF